MNRSVIDPPAPAELSRDSIAQLVARFYDDVRADSLLGPTFEAVLRGRWDAHLARMVEFWSTVALGSRSFTGNVLASHPAVPGVTAAHFERWIDLWTRHTQALFSPATARRLQVVARGIARNLLKGNAEQVPRGARIPGLGRAAALQMLAIPAGMSALCALLRIPIQGARTRGDLFSVALARTVPARSFFDGGRGRGRPAGGCRSLAVGATRPVARPIALRHPGPALRHRAGLAPGLQYCGRPTSQPAPRHDLPEHPALYRQPMA